MNDRIKELVKQAGLDDDMFPIDEWDNPDLEKFAELIVKECITQCWTVSELESKGFVVSECSKRIRKHFGVEE